MILALILILFVIPAIFMIVLFERAPQGCESELGFRLCSGCNGYGCPSGKPADGQDLGASIQAGKP